MPELNIMEPSRIAGKNLAPNKRHPARATPAGGHSETTCVCGLKLANKKPEKKYARKRPVYIFFSNNFFPT